MNNCEPLISIIIPVYNVEKYLKRSIESVINQTYTNLEIILVDDGSTDNSGIMCDEFQKRDNRIIVYHKTNGGQGSARNVGLEVFKGEFVSFLDSDDYLEKDFIEILYNSLVKKELDISSCNYTRVDENGIFLSVFDDKYKGFVVDGEEALLRMWYHEVINLAPWGKLYKRELWDGILFAEYKYDEDYATMHYVYLKAKRFGYTNKALVNYTIRMNSAVRIFNDEKIQILEIADLTVKYCEGKSQALMKASLTKAVSTYFHILMKLPSLDGNYTETVKRCKAFISNNRIKVLMDKRCSLKIKAALLISCLSIRLARYVYSCSKKKNVLR